MTPERLAYEKQCASHNVVYTGTKFTDVLDNSDDTTVMIPLFQEWGKSLLVAKEFGVEVDTRNYTAKAAILLDHVLRDAQDTKNPLDIHEWQVLYAHVMKNFARLGVRDSQFDLVVLFGSKRLGVNT